MTKSLQQFKAVVFDFDGTLADSYAAIASSVNHVRSVRGLEPLDIEKVKRFVGRGADYLLTNTIPAGTLADNLACYRAHHPSVMMALTHFLPGAIELLRGLDHVGKKIGLCSNKPRLFSEKLLAHFGIASHFSAVLGPEDVPLPKPAPDMLLLAMERLGLSNDQVLYVGDMVVDIETARAAKVCVWAAPTGSEERRTLETAMPDRMLNSLLDMVAEVNYSQ